MSGNPLEFSVPVENGAPSPSSAPAPSGVVVVAASAGGLEAVGTLVSRLPASFPLPLILVLHRAPSAAHDHLVRLLQHRTKLRVTAAHQGATLGAGTLYVAPTGRHISVAHDRTISLWFGAPIHHVRPSADPLFASAAAVYGAEAIGVVLTGGDGDGSFGVRIIKAGGGTVLAQDRESSRVFAMPAAAAATGLVDAVLPPGEIAVALQRLTGTEPATEPPRLVAAPPVPAS